VRIAKDLDDIIENEDVLLADIVDTGLTLRYLMQALSSRGPNSLAVCTFLDRNSRRLVHIPRGIPLLRNPRPLRHRLRLDHNQLYRNLSYVGCDEAGQERVTGGAVRCVCWCLPATNRPYKIVAPIGAGAMRAVDPACGALLTLPKVRNYVSALSIV
jgi:hypothetical protein